MNDQAAKIHAFEQAGLGKAPFKIIGFEGVEDRIAHNVSRAAHGLTYTTNACGGTCDYCGKAIFNVYRIRSADQKEFAVGCDCVCKTGDAGMVKIVTDIAKEHAKARRQAREDAKIAEAETALEREDVQAALIVKAHPCSGRNGLPSPTPSYNALTYVHYCLKNGGQSGRLRAAEMVLAVAKGEVK
jgi:hypothetical protein